MNRSVIRNILLFLSISRFFNSLRYTYFGKYFNEFQDLKIYKKKNFTAKPIKKLSYIQGIEYLSKNFNNFLKEEQILHQLINVEYISEKRAKDRNSERSPMKITEYKEIFL